MQPARKNPTSDPPEVHQPTLETHPSHCGVPTCCFGRGAATSGAYKGRLAPQAVAPKCADSGHQSVSTSSAYARPPLPPSRFSVQFRRHCFCVRRCLSANVSAIVCVPHLFGRQVALQKKQTHHRETRSASTEVRHPGALAFTHKGSCSRHIHGTSVCCLATADSTACASLKARRIKAEELGAKLEPTNAFATTPNGRHAVL